jgi:taurine dioxygenase
MPTGQPEEKFMSSDFHFLEVQPISSALGVEIRGVDLTHTLNDDVFAEIHQAFTEYQVLFFRDQPLTIEQLKNFSRRFGPLSRVPYVEPLADHPDVIAVLKEADETNISTFGGSWHSDFSFLDEPPLGSVLYGAEVPALGGDTLWSNMCAAYEALSAGLRATLDQLTALHSGHVYGAARPPLDMRTSRSINISRHNPEADNEHAHPAVIVHPQSRRKALFVNPIYTTRFAEMSAAESAPLLQYLYEHATRAEFTCRFRWQPHSVALWDNRCTMHLAINDYDGRRRLMYRTTIAGARPVGVVPR